MKKAMWLVDAVCWAAGLTTAAWVGSHDIGGALLATAVAVPLHSLIGHALYVYRRRYPNGSFGESGALASTVLATAACLLVVPFRTVPLSAVVAGGPLALILMLSIRYLRRLRAERNLRPDGRIATPVLLFGAGAAAHQLVSSMVRDPSSRYLPVGMLDDDQRKRHLSIDGVRVLGAREDLAEALAHTGAKTLVFSVANANTALIRDIRARTVSAGAEFKMLPSVSELLDSHIGVTDVREVQVDIDHLRDVQFSDLLGRHQFETDIGAIAKYLKGKRVLVSGAGGSIGSELCRQIDRFQPSELMMLDRDESALHALELSMRGEALLKNPNLILADLRDAEGIRAIFAARDPQVVFHAAALKHLPLLERHPGEAVKTNVWGTLTMLEASSNVEKFVNISTDKAASPISVLGYSKRITERLTASAAASAQGALLSVRFGNVLGSRGSVMTTFSAQIAAGGPITVTHPEVTRYFMTIQEAVQLVIQAAAIGKPGEALVLDMGQPVRIADAARQLAELAPTQIEIVYTGLRPGEKLHENLFGPGEEDLRPLHPLISHLRVPPLDPALVRSLDPYGDPEKLQAQLAELC
jgi:FlaA1/EpsC-like NDP-sugar epimerase